MTFPRITIPLLAVLSAVSGCGGGGSSPTAPTPRASVVGEWAASRIVWLRTEPADSCFGRWLEIEGRGRGHAFTAQVSIESLGGGRIRGTLTNTQILSTCQFEGTETTSGQVTWRQTGCTSPCSVFAHPSNPCNSFQICVVDHSFTSSAGSPATGTHEAVWELRDELSGQALGRTRVIGELAL
jgi:hypothetical protein